MLHRLTIRNYAIIDKLEIEFCDRMNIITGETGAGKSILLGALSLILGERADTKALYNQDEKCVVEADFEIENKGLKSFFADNELDFDTHTIVRREINQSGKSRAFINDTPVTLTVLKQLGEKLVNLHSQHETLELTRAGFQLDVIDTLARNQDLLQTYRGLFNRYKKDHKRLEVLAEQFRTSSAELDYLQFQYNELAEAKLEADEQNTLEAEQNTLSNVEEIKIALQSSIQILSEGEISTLDQLSEVQGQLKSVKNYNNDILALSQRLQSAYEEIKDITKEFEGLQDTALLDPERLEEVNNRLTTIYRLQKKHNTTTVEELLKIQSDLEQKIASVDNNSADIEQIKAQLEKQFHELLAIAEQLHQSREKVLREFQNNVVVLLTKVGMPNSVFKVDIKKLEHQQLNENGLTEIKFLFSANKGFAPHEIKDVASGGELSRLMLCIKSLLADAGALPTLIFDEIDTGISGEVALKVGEIMKKLSRNHQLISITHLPQIARTADAHLYIYKEVKDNRTNTRIKELKGEERVIEIAKMLSGDKISDASLANARELIAS
ncbi:MAG TPA: DNA repair protein RecN [Chitinophagales bacterium]|nr:DNA repair protein RecN [Chitinophagales bacterium]